MRYLKTIFYCFLLLFILLGSLLAFLLTTTPGLYTVIKLANLSLAGKIHLKKPRGRLIDQFSFSNLRYVDDTLNISIINGRLTWKLTSLLHHELTIIHLEADKISVHIKDAPKPIEKKAPTDFTLPRLPFHFKIDELKIKEIQIKQAKMTRTVNNLHLKTTLNNQQWFIKLKADYNHHHFSLQASGQPQAPYTLSALFHFKSLNQEANGLQGTIKLAGDLSLYHWQGQFSGQLSGTLRGTLKNGREWHGVLHTPQGDILSTMFYHKQSTPKLRGEIKTKAFNVSDFNLPFNDVAFNVQFSGNSLQAFSTKTNLKAHYLGHLLRAGINTDPKQFDATLSLGANHISLNGYSPYPWQGKLILPQLKLLHPMLAGLQTVIQANITLENAQRGKLTMDISPGAYHSQDNQDLPIIPFQGGHLRVNLSREALNAKATFTIDKQKSLNAFLQLPHFRIDEATSLKQVIQGNLSLNIDSLDFLQGISPAIEKPRGQLNVKLTTQGTLNKPNIHGELELRHASVFIPPLNLTLNPIQTTLKSHNKQWSAEGSVGSHGKALIIHGQGDFDPVIRGEITIHGEDFLTMNTAEYRINISPQLTLNFKPNSLTIHGTILVPDAQLKPIALNNSTDLTEDAVFVHDKSTATPFRINTDVQIKMGKKVALDVQGLRGFLNGAIQLIHTPERGTSALGQLMIRDGKYQAYGQDLVIEEAQLLFGGGLISNPGIRMRAVRYFKNATSSVSGSDRLFDFNLDNLQSIDLGNKTTVGIEISGRLNSPKVKLFSIPPNLSQADILSMLILGKPASQASQSGGQLLLTAISAMNLDSGTKGLQLLDQLKQKLGFDFNVQSTSSYNQETNQVTDSTAFVVGKSLTSRLYLSYNIGLFQNDRNVLTLKYLLNKFFSIQISTSDSGSGIDLLYTHRKE